VVLGCINNLEFALTFFYYDIEDCTPMETQFYLYISLSITKNCRNELTPKMSSLGVYTRLFSYSNPSIINATKYIIPTSTILRKLISIKLKTFNNFTKSIHVYKISITNLKCSIYFPEP